MLTELCGKAGQVCRHAKTGQIRCPLILRRNSEDLITANLCQTMRILNPRWWLPDILNIAVRARRFRRQVFRQLEIEPWRNRPRYPRELLPWDEGSTQVDLTITWENPPTTVYIELKYLADLAAKTTNGNGDLPTDQLIRNARVGLLECGYFRQEELFATEPRDFVLLLVGPTKGHPLVAKYRDVAKLRAAIPHSDRLRELPRLPFIGELSYADIARALRRNRQWFTRSERELVDHLVEYLAYKVGQISAPQQVR